MFFYASLPLIAMTGSIPVVHKSAPYLCSQYLNYTLQLQGISSNLAQCPLDSTIHVMILTFDWMVNWWHIIYLKGQGLSSLWHHDILQKKKERKLFQQLFWAQEEQLDWPAEAYSCKTVILIHDETFCHGSESLSPRLLPLPLANSVLTRGKASARCGVEQMSLCTLLQIS